MPDPRRLAWDEPAPDDLLEGWAEDEDDDEGDTPST